MKKEDSKSKQFLVSEIEVKQPVKPKIVPKSVEWMKKGKDATCAY